MRRKIAAGNWKMNGALSELDALYAAHPTPTVDVLICPPATMIAQARKGAIAIGGQDCHEAQSGAHTGDISAGMLVQAGASHVIVGHSERRMDHHETDVIIAQKARAAYQAGLIAVLCIGETLQDQNAGTTLNVLGAQLAEAMPDTATAENTIIAYEPVWAIGTGKIPTLAQIAQVHAFIRTELTIRFDDGADFRILYGGSVKANNATEIFAVADVDGALVGGASLKAADFGPIITALQNA